MRNALLTLIFFSVLSLASTARPSVALVVPSDDVPESFELIGVYLVHSISRVRHGQTMTMPSEGTRYRVYSNKQKLRIYQNDVSESYHSYDIYRSDGIAVEATHGSISVTPGLQAKHSATETIKQLSMTQEFLTITQFPPISDTIVITFAKRLAVKPTNR